MRICITRESYHQYLRGYAVPVSHILSTREDMQYPWIFSPVKQQLHDAIYQLWFYWSSLIHILSLSNSYNNVASIQKNQGDKLHHIIVAFGGIPSVSKVCSLLEWCLISSIGVSIVPQLSKCLKSEAVWGVITDQMIWIWTVVSSVPVREITRPMRVLFTEWRVIIA